MKQNCKSHKNQLGFTMIEVVVVLIVLAIITAVVLSRFETTGNELMVETDGLKSSLRYAQIQALNDDTATWGIHFPDDASFILYKNGAAAPVSIPVKIPDPAKDPDTVSCPKSCHKLQSNVKITSEVPKTITYNKWGSPGTSTINVILSRQGDNSSKFAISPNTGFIYDVP